jgi:hypothetical protein
MNIKYKIKRDFTGMWCKYCAAWCEAYIELPLIKNRKMWSV